MLSANCPICQWTSVDTIEDYSGNMQVTCPRCGRYRLNYQSDRFQRAPERIRLSCATRQYWEAHQEALQVTDSNVNDLIAAHKSASVSDTSEKLLKLLANRAPRPADSTPIVFERDFTLLDLDRSQDLRVHLQWLGQEGFINQMVGGGNPESYNFSLQKRGWEFLRPSRQLGGKPGTCFVAMWFAKEMDPVYDNGIAPAITECGYKDVRIDRKEHNNQITDEIMADIRGAEFMVADFTGGREGVYYEAGFARGLGRDVISCCRCDWFDRIHFDTKIINHIKWETLHDLKASLTRRIRGSIIPRV
jgi:hypothetical protein